MFIGGLALIGFIIFASQKTSRHDSSPVPALPSMRTVTEEQITPGTESARKATEERAKFIARYINPDTARVPEKKSVAVLVVSESGKLNRTIASVLMDRVRNDRVVLLPSFFKPEFVADGLFGKALSGSTTLFGQLELEKVLDILLLARQSVQYTTNQSLENVITANMSLEISAIPIITSLPGDAWTLTANGAGFTPGQARQMAEERLLSQIASDTKIRIPD